MVFSDFALGFLTNLIYDSVKNIPEEISDIYSEVYDKAIEEFSNKHYKLNGMQIDTFFHQENVEIAIRKYLKNPDKLGCSNVLIQEFFELFDEEDFSYEDADSILNTFFEILDAEIEKYPELIIYLDHYLAKRTDKTVQETNKGIQGLSRDVKEISETVQEIRKVVNEGREDQTKKELNKDFDESIKKYLNKIIDEESRTGISEVYTELSAKEILPITLKFRDEVKDKTQEFEVLELVEKEEKLIISGESGSGKTTTLRWLNFTFATKYLENKECSIPLYVELNSYRNGPFYDYFKRQIKKKGLSETALKTLLEEKAIILLDGLDLLSPTENFFPYDEISDFFSDHSNCQIIISSRLGFFESIRRDFKVSKLEKLTNGKIQMFIEKYVEEKELADTLKDKILSNEQLKSILSNPMMLYIAIKVSMERKNKSEDLLPSNSSELYEAFISTLFSHQEKKGKRLHADRIQIENALTDLYFKLQCRNEVSCKYGEALKIVKKSSEDDAFRKTTSQDILEDCFKVGLLVKKDSEIGYGVHQSFQEYFAAIRLKELFESEFDVSEAFSHPKWEEVVRFTSEMLNQDTIDKFIDLMISKGELFSASKYANRASDGIKEKLCSLLADKINSKYELEKINSIESLGRIGTSGVSIIAEAVRSKDECVRRIAINTLENIKSDVVVPPVATLNDEKKNTHIWNIGKFSFEMMKQYENLYIVLGIAKKDDEFMQMLVEDWLVYIKSKVAVKQLISLLKDRDVELYERFPGEKQKDEAIIKLSVDLLKSEPLLVTHILGIIGSEKEVQLLISILKDKYENSDVRDMAASALTFTKSGAAVQPLVDSLKDESWSVRLGAARAFGILKSEKAVQPLINLLKDEDESMRLSAAIALRKNATVKNKTQLEDLLKSDHKFSINRAFEILSEIEKEERSKIILFKDEKFLKI